MEVGPEQNCDTSNLKKLLFLQRTLDLANQMDHVVAMALAKFSLSFFIHASGDLVHFFRAAYESFRQPILGENVSYLFKFIVEDKEVLARVLILNVETTEWAAHDFFVSKVVHCAHISISLLQLWKRL